MNRVLHRLKEFFSSASVENSFRLDGAVPFGNALAIGLQHALAMFVNNVAPVLIIFALAASKSTAPIDPNLLGNAIRGAIFMAGLGTVIQLYPIAGKIGAKLPMVVGASFTFVGVLTVIAYTYGLGTMYVSIMVGGLCIIPLGLFAHKWVHFIKPVVCALVVIGLGFSILSSLAKDYLGIGQPGVISDGVYQFHAAWPYFLVATITMIACLLWQVLVKGKLQNLSIIFGLVIGFAVACCFIPYNGMVNFSVFRFNSVSDYIDVPRPVFTLLPLSWSDFNIGPILIVLLIYIVSTVESLGALGSLTATACGRAPTDKEVRGMVTANGVNGALCGFFGGTPNGIYAQNVGIVSQTKCINRYSILTGGCLLILVSFLTPVSTLLRCIPSCVLAGMLVSLFGSILVIGMQMLAQCGFGKKNVLIASVSIGLGLSITLVTELTNSVGLYDAAGLNYLVALISSPVANMFIISLILSYVIPDSYDGPKKKTDSGEEPVSK